MPVSNNNIHTKAPFTCNHHKYTSGKDNVNAPEVVTVDRVSQLTWSNLARNIVPIDYWLLQKKVQTFLILSQRVTSYPVKENNISYNLLGNQSAT